MGWRFSRSINLGPLRINLSKRGIGASIGAGPVRIGRSAAGKTYGSARIPGTGISYRTQSPEGVRAIGKGCLLAIVAGVALVAIVGIALALFLRSTT